jgi:hypothetical protein
MPDAANQRLVPKGARSWNAELQSGNPSRLLCRAERYKSNAVLIVMIKQIAAEILIDESVGKGVSLHARNKVSVAYII